MADGAAQEEEQVGPLPPPDLEEEAEADVGPVLPKPKKRKARHRNAPLPHGAAAAVPAADGALLPALAGSGV